jgi:LacI family transcriptional regulator
MKANPQVLLLIDPMPIARYEGIMSFAQKHNWFVERVNRHTPPEYWIGDGVLVMLDHLHPLDATLRHCRKHNIPVVDLMAMLPQVKLPRVIGDNYEIGRLAAEHLLKRDFKNTAWYSESWSPTHALRYEGFCSLFRENTPARWVWHDDSSEYNKQNWNARRIWLTNKLLGAPKPIGIFTYSDTAASVVENAALAAGLSIPEDVAILGVDDDSFICERQPIPLSSVRHDHFRVGWEGAALLEKLMNGEVPPTSPLLITPRGLTFRRSTDVTAIQNPIVRAAIAAIRANLAHPPTYSDIARQLNISRSCLIKTFKNELGRTLSSEIINQRLAMACTLLDETDMKLDAIARETGFCHASYLLNSFKRHYGITPLKWRKLNHSSHQK